MRNHTNELEQIVIETTKRLLTISEEKAQTASNGDVWSAKQVLGHLIDSASNNHARFVRAQFASQHKMVSYHQEDWVATQRYGAESWSNLVQLWTAFNLHIAHVVRYIPESALAHTVDASVVGIDEPLTLEFLIADYIDHLNGHLRQLFATVG